MSETRVEATMEWVPLNKVTSPLGPVGKVAIASTVITSGVAPTEWLDVDAVINQLLITHPITVIKVKRRYEIARGFHSLSEAELICPSDQMIPVYVSEKSESELIKLSVFDVVYTTLLHSGVSAKQRREAYWCLKEMFTEMREDNIPIPAELTTGAIRRLLRLSTHQSKRPRVRHSELARALANS